MVNGGMLNEGNRCMGGVAEGRRTDVRTNGRAGMFQQEIMLCVNRACERTGARTNMRTLVRPCVLPACGIRLQSSLAN